MAVVVPIDRNIVSVPMLGDAMWYRA